MTRRSTVHEASRAEAGRRAVEPDLASLSEAPSIGEGIRRERLRRGLTLAQLAAQVNLTVSALSQIERGASDPSISSLRRIAGAFNIPMFQFLVGTDRREIVVRRNQRKRIGSPTRSWTTSWSRPTRSASSRSSRAHPARGCDGTVATSHSSEECSIVVSGAVIAEVAGRTLQLDAGDSIKIHRELPHRFLNPGGGDASILIVISPPTF